MKTSETISALAKALAAAQAEYVPVSKNKTAKVKTKQGYEYSYKYADLADILAMSLPRLAKHGIAFSQPHEIVDGRLRVASRLIHESGEWMQSDGIEISEDGDPQQFGAESTYFRRYDGASLLGIAPDEDTDAQQAGDRQRKATESAETRKREAKPKPAEAKAEESATQEKASAGRLLDAKERKQLFDDCYSYGGNNDTVAKYIQQVTGQGSTKLVTVEDADKIRALVYKHHNPPLSPEMEAAADDVIAASGGEIVP